MCEEKAVRIFCDFCADPIWGINSGNYCLDDLPVDAELRDGLRAWSDRYQAECPIDDGEWPNVEDFARVGEDLARGVKRQLPDWKIVYVNEARIDPLNFQLDPSVYKYEITLDN